MGYHVDRVLHTKRQIKFSSTDIIEIVSLLPEVDGDEGVGDCSASEEPQQTAEHVHTVLTLNSNATGFSILLQLLFIITFQRPLIEVKNV